MLHKCEGIVIRTNAYGENNKILTIFSEELGKVGVMARGANKPSSRFTAVSQLFSHATFVFQRGTGLGSLQQGEIMDSMRSIREDIFLTAYASYIVELMDKVTEEGIRNQALYKLLYQVLHFMDDGYDPEILTFIYELKMCDRIGITPQLNGCASCGAKEGNFAFSIKEGGFLCNRCFHKDSHLIKISPATLKILRALYYYDLDRMGNITLKEETRKEIRFVIDEYYEAYSGIMLKSKRFLKQMGALKANFEQNDRT
ncbi:DNA repair protein RecO [Sutcliffiella rhizosphaerae]|uniref:DNA repair protein RecO n=1 Tax=Sutcliffiella rhizosphaerae TaxID=2880967 RepID=A0ABN8A2W9_9BACI|nr:DNA repair protein RecO [Sutcliffiella rhizosphaerae]CAG9619349.1 DNA repair protein RecO [Sutcliffiella rhizosphaerae]